MIMMAPATRYKDLKREEYGNGMHNGQKGFRVYKSKNLNKEIND